MRPSLVVVEVVVVMVVSLLVPVEVVMMEVNPPAFLSLFTPKQIPMVVVVVVVRSSRILLVLGVPSIGLPLVLASCPPPPLPTRLQPTPAQIAIMVVEKTTRQWW